MAITKGKSLPQFFTSDGNAYPSMELAQRAELLKLLTPEGTVDISDTRLQQINTVLDALFARLDDVRAILRATGRRPRKAKGNGRPRARRNTAEKAEVAK